MNDFLTSDAGGFIAFFAGVFFILASVWIVDQFQGWRRERRREKRRRLE